MTLSLSPKIRIMFNKYIYPALSCFPCCYGYADINEAESILPIITAQSENKVMVDKSNQTDENENFEWDVL